MSDWTRHCTDDCFAMPVCAVCGLKKRPTGRSVPLEMENSLCGWDCYGYVRFPKAGHLWPGEGDGFFGGSNDEETK